MPHLAAITIYPIKALDGQALTSARVLASGALEHDRRFALVDLAGHFLNGKRTDRLHALRSALDLDHRRLELQHGEEITTFDLDEDREEIERYFTQVLGQPARWVENAAAGFPDDTAAPGPTLVSTATLATVARWFPGLSVDEVRRRFRANLEIDGVEPFWEDRLVGEQGQSVRFRLGNVAFDGVNPCQRCVVPTRDSHHGQPWPGFQKEFASQRAASLPPWAPRSRFDHYYRLAVNTRVPSAREGTIAVGDELTLQDA